MDPNSNRLLKYNNSRRRSSAQSTAKAKRQTRKLVILGSTKCGKTAFLKRYLDDTYMNEYTPTVEDCYNRDIEYKGFTLNLDIIDMCELYMFPAMRDLHLRSANIIMILYEMENERSIKEAADAYELVQKFQIDRPSIILVGTKLDLHGKFKSSESYPLESKYSSILSNLDEQHFITSAKKNINVREAFEAGFDGIIRRVGTLSLSRNKILELQKSEKSCCTIL